MLNVGWSRACPPRRAKYISVVRGWPVVGTAPMLFRRAFDGSVGRDSLYHDLLTMHGPIFKIFVMGVKCT